MKDEHGMRRGRPASRELRAKSNREVEETSALEWSGDVFAEARLQSSRVEALSPWWSGPFFLPEAVYCRCFEL